MAKRIALMQPYLFPYLGYFQLAASVDEFCILDTVSFIQAGWMNRNRLREPDGSSSYFTLPVETGSHKAPISKRKFHCEADRSLNKLSRRLLQHYARAPYRDEAVSIVQTVREVLANSSRDFVDVTAFALDRCLHALSIDTPVSRASQLNLPTELTGQERVIAACSHMGANEYLNMAGGQSLYDAQSFVEAGIQLLFLEADLRPYPQGGLEFMPNLSVLDFIANVEPAERKAKLGSGIISPAVIDGD